MTNNNAVCSRVLQGVFLVILLAAFGLTACSSGGGSTTSDTNTTTPPATLTTYTITASAGAGGTVTPSGATTVTQGASQSYTITPGAGYAIATLVIDGFTVANSSTHTFTNVQANHTISATFSTAAPGGIALSLVPARTSGVAPLAVFFDASATTDTGVTTRPFHDLEYTWDFGDPGSGTWANGAQPGVSSKNSATGPVAAHVFEAPGTYIVTMQAYDGVNTNATTTTITVQDPDVIFAGTNTICVSSNTTPTAGANGCPSGAQTVMQSNFATAVNTYALTNRRVLFKRGDTFSAPTSAAITSTGPGILGAFGSGAAPIVQASTAALYLSSSNTPTIKDWRVMDIDIIGPGLPVESDGVGLAGGIEQVTLLRLFVSNMRTGFHGSDTILDWWNNNNHPGHKMWDQITIVDSTVNSPSLGTNSYGVALSADRLFFSGNLIDLENASLPVVHVLRIFYTSKSVISNNTLQRPGQATSGSHALKLHAPTWTSTGVAHNGVGGGYGRYILITDNKFIGGVSDAWTTTVGPQNAQSDERIRDVIFERNWLVSGSATQVAALFWATDSTIRNNICDMTGALYHGCVYVGQRGVEPASNNIHIYNNTFYSASAGDFYGVNIGATATNVVVMNNLSSAPLATNPVMISGTGASGLIQSNNSTNTQIKSTFPGWVSAAPSTPADFSLTAGSYAREAGFAVPVWSDFFRTSRPQNGVIDIGAVEGP